MLCRHLSHHNLTQAATKRRRKRKHGHQNRKKKTIKKQKHRSGLLKRLGYLSKLVSNAQGCINVKTILVFIVAFILFAYRNIRLGIDHEINCLINCVL